MKKLLTALIASLLIPVLTGCSQGTMEQTPTSKESASQTEAVSAAAEVPAAPAASETAGPAAGKEDVTIIYTNDIHSFIYNIIKEKDSGKEYPGLRVSNVAAMKKDLLSAGKNVLLVDAGDEIQGNIYGSMDKGETVINIMNSAGYDLACPGNHEFDYGVANFFDRIAQAEYPFISCTFRNVSDRTTVLDQYKIFDIGGMKIAFVGISTPETITSTARTTFQDENRNQIYTFSGIKDAEELYSDVQAAIDSAAAEADIVIGLGHAGQDTSARALGISSRDIIAHTEGLSAFIDGHSHTVVPSDSVKDKNGRDVLLTQTGCYLSHIGVMTVAADGSVSTKLVSEYDSSDEITAAAEDLIDGIVREFTGTKLGELAHTLVTHDPAEPEHRLVRTQETNLGDFISDAYYWYLNTNSDADCDVVINNGGGLRAPLNKGDVTYLDVKNVVPFNNTICIIKVTGAELRDIFENGVMATGLWDPELNIPAEQGAFMHAAGVRFTVDASVPCSVVYENEAFKEVTGEYRVRDLQVYNRQTGTYEDVDPDKTYNLGSIDYVLRNGGCGLNFLSDCEVVLGYAGPEVELVIEYINSFEKKDGLPYINSANSPLSAYKGYLLDYENPYGSGRINIINLSYKN